MTSGEKLPEDLRLEYPQINRAFRRVLPPELFKFDDGAYQFRFRKLTEELPGGPERMTTEGFGSQVDTLELQ